MPTTQRAALLTVSPHDAVGLCIEALQTEGYNNIEVDDTDTLISAQVKKYEISLVVSEASQGSHVLANVTGRRSMADFLLFGMLVGFLMPGVRGIAKGFFSTLAEETQVFGVPANLPFDQRRL